MSRTSAIAGAVLLTCWAGDARAQYCFPPCPTGHSCQAGTCAPICFGGCPAGQQCTAPATCTGQPAAHPAAQAAASVGSEATAEACRNQLDDDGDGTSDCADSECSLFVFCQGAAPSSQVVLPPGVVSAPQASQTIAASSVTAAATSGTGPPEQEPDAANGAYPLRYVDRPITHRQGTLVPTLALGMGIPTNGGDAGVAMNIGLQAGILNYLQLDVAPVRAQLAPSPELHDPAVGVTFRFFPNSVFEMGFRTVVIVPFDGGNVSQGFIVPLRFHLGHVARIDLGAQFSLYYDDSVDQALLSIPFALAFNLGPYFFFALETEFFTWTDTLDDSSMNYAIRLGGTIPHRDRRPLADLELRVVPFGLDFGSGGSGETGGRGPELDTDSVEIHFTASFYFHLSG